MKKFVAILLSFFLLLFVSSGAIYAKTVYQEKGSITIAKNEIVNDDLFAGGENVTIEGTVNGDVFIGAGTVKVSGKVNGNLHIGAGSVTLSGPVSGNVYVGSGWVDITGAKIGGSLLVGTGTLNIDKESAISGSLLAGGGTINNKAPVARNVMVGAGMISLDSSVGGEVKLGGGKIDLGPKTSIGGSLTYTLDETGSNFTMAEGATVAGQIKKIETKSATAFRARTKANQAALRSTRFGLGFISFLGALIIGFLWVRFLPKWAEEITGIIKKSFFPSLGTGLLVTILALPVLLLMAITVIGLPLAGISFTVLMFSFYLSKIALGFWAGDFLGQKLGGKKMSLYASFTLGLFVVYVLKGLPYVGIFFSLLIGLTGLGSLFLCYKRSLFNQ
jgi:cytoskeletal protein CcmA (bactofilin family)